MAVPQYPLVLAKRLDEDGCAALVEMADEREERVTRAIDQRFSVYEHRVDERFTVFEHRMDLRFAAVDQQFAALERRMDQRFAVIDQRMAVFDQRLETQTEQFGRRLVEEFGHSRVDIASLRTEMVQQRADLMKWAMVFWISQAAAIAGILSVLR